MFLPTISIVTLTTFLLSSVLAQVPAKLSNGFNTEIQVNFQGDSSQGFPDGEVIPFPDTANVPVFALGDASGVNTAVSYMIVMIDSTDENNFIMHYLRTDFKATGDKTGLASSTAPMIPYSQPGSFGETGSRKYTFLLYQQKSAELTSMPQAGGRFDYEAFGAANELKPPVAGVAMAVSIGDTAAADPAADPAAGAAAPPPPPTTPEAPPTDAPASPPSTPSTTETTTTASPTPSSATPGANTNTTDPGAAGLTQKAPPAGSIVIGGGIVTERPFPPEAGDGAAIVGSIASLMNSTAGASVDSVVAEIAAPSVQEGAGNVVPRAGASMAALVVMVGAFACI